MFWNQVEKERVGERERRVLESSIRKRSRKKGEDRNRSGYACVVEKKQEKKKNVWMKERKNNIKNKK